MQARRRTRDGAFFVTFPIKENSTINKRPACSSREDASRSRALSRETPLTRESQDTTGEYDESTNKGRAPVIPLSDQRHGSPTCILTQKSCEATRENVRGPSASTRARNSSSTSLVSSLNDSALWIRV